MYSHVAAERTRDRWISYPPGVEIDVAREMMRTTFDIILNTMLSEPNSIDCDLMQDAIVDYLEPVSWIIALAMIRAPRNDAGRKSPAQNIVARVRAQGRRSENPGCP
jgi:hypothetical protein